MGWWASDTATLNFDDCRVPVENLIGEEARVSRSIMHISQRAHGYGGKLHGLCARLCRGAIAYAKERQTFGNHLAAPGDPHKLAIWRRRSGYASDLEMLAWRLGRREPGRRDLHA